MNIHTHSSGRPAGRSITPHSDDGLRRRSGPWAFLPVLPLLLAIGLTQPAGVEAQDVTIERTGTVDPITGEVGSGTTGDLTITLTDATITADDTTAGIRATVRGTGDIDVGVSGSTITTEGSGVLTIQSGEGDTGVTVSDTDISTGNQDAIQVNVLIGAGGDITLTVSGSTITAMYGVYGSHGRGSGDIDITVSDTDLFPAAKSTLPMASMVTTGGLLAMSP